MNSKSLSSSPHLSSPSVRITSKPGLSRQISYISEQYRSYMVYTSCPDSECSLIRSGSYYLVMVLSHHRCLPVFQETWASVALLSLIHQQHTSPSSQLAVLRVHIPALDSHGNLRQIQLSNSTAPLLSGA